MHVSFDYGRRQIGLEVPDGAMVYRSRYPEVAADARDAVLGAVRTPIDAPPLREAVAGKEPGDVVVVVSDVTRPVPYRSFLPALLKEVEAGGVSPDQILILVACGFHRPMTHGELEEMVGEVVERYRVVNHRAVDEENLVKLPRRSWAGAEVRLDRRYVEAGFRLITGLVEPHFMAGFSGGRKAVCPGLVALETVRHFHGPAFIGNRNARNGRLSGNPVHMEALSVARTAGVDFSVNVVADRERRVIRAFAGELEQAHEAACELVARAACPTVEAEADLVITSSGGYPLDATFYQCVKGFVSCLPAVRPHGALFALGACSEGVGGAAYGELMEDYSGRWRDFLKDVRKADFFIKDQWQLQMHIRALEKVGRRNLHFLTDGLSRDRLGTLSVTPHAVDAEEVASAAQSLVDQLAREADSVAVLPEGPYCAPVPPASAGASEPGPNA